MAGTTRNPLKTVFNVFLGTLALVVIVAIFWPVTTGGGEPSHRTACLSHMKQLALAVIMYSTDFDDRLPPAPTWADLTKPYTKNGEIYECPGLEDRKPNQFGHAFRRAVALKLEKDIASPPDEPMLFDSTDLSWNANGDFSLVPPAGRHPFGTNCFGFVDGHCKWMTTDRFFCLHAATRIAPVFVANPRSAERGLLCYTYLP